MHNVFEDYSRIVFIEYFAKTFKVTKGRLK